jgi:hypothetical protein
MARRLAAIALLLLIAIAAVGPIRSYDFFWHLATGRWIVEHHALPTYDPFALASAHVPWINGEWLYDVALDGAYWAGGFPGISWINALFVAVIFTAGFWFASTSVDVAVAALAAAVAFGGASDRLGVRPSTAAALLIVGALALLSSSTTIARLSVAYALLTVVWINTHPSALLAPVLAAATLLVDKRRWMVVAGSAVALLVNPFGWEAITAPLRLTQLVGSGEFVNAEWLPSSPSLFPLLYETIAAIIVLFLFSRQKRRNAWRFVAFVLLAALAMQHVRNQGLYFAALPLLVPAIAPLSRNRSITVAMIAVVPLAWVLIHGDRRIGIDDIRFPVRAVGRLQTAGLPGNIYNVDQFGGYLEWVFYPQRRVLTDGRNELFRDFIAEDFRARQDSRVWHSLLAQYHLDLAVDEYQRNKVEVIDAASGERRTLPASLVRYRRRHWALITFDDAAMVFARRAAFPPEIIERLEYRYLVPDDPSIRFASDAIRMAARAEVARAQREIGDLNVVRELDRGTRN